jgi:hypothetical protein
MCFKCKTTVNQNAMFPGHLCKDCYVNMVESVTGVAPSEADISTMFSVALIGGIRANLQATASKRAAYAATEPKMIMMAYHREGYASESK